MPLDGSGYFRGLCRNFYLTSFSLELIFCNKRMAPHGAASLSNFWTSSPRHMRTRLI